MTLDDFRRIQSRRSFFRYCAGGLETIALAHLMEREGYAGDARGNETQRVMASGSAVARTINTTWHATFHLPTQIVDPGREMSAIRWFLRILPALTRPMAMRPT